MPDMDKPREQIGKLTEGDLRREVSMNIKRLMDLGATAATRHRKVCPCAASAFPHQCAYPQHPRKAIRSRASKTSRGKHKHGQAHRLPRASARGQKQCPEGIAHVHASFNNTIITITDRQGNCCLGRPREALVLKGLAQVHAVCGAGGCRGRWQGRHRVRHQEPGGAHQGTGPGRIRCARSMPWVSKFCRSLT